MKRVLVVFPTVWDERQLAACRPDWEDRFEVVLAEPKDHETDPALDIHDYIARTVEAHRGKIDGVMSSSDYPGATVAAAVATELGLPGSPPATVIGCSHKYASRLAQREAVPEATPAFALVDPDRPDELPSIGLPCFVKPVKGAFSVFARKIERPEELAAMLRSRPLREFRDSFMRIFNALVARYTDLDTDGRWFIAEELITGHDQVTVEGYVAGGAPEVIGVVDSVVHPTTRSFVRFDYPSALPPAVKERMRDIARRAIARLGLRWSFFNIEMTYEPATDRIAILEINPRLCGQFADLYDKVDGTSSYELALTLATGETPRRRPGHGPDEVAASIPLRTFEPVRIVRAPDEDDVRAAEALFDGVLAWSECASGEQLTDFESWEDGVSARYGIVNLGAADREELFARFAAVKARLGYELAPLRPEGESGA